jgi:hypothetical protein
MDPNDEMQMMVARTDPDELQMTEALAKSMAILRNDTLYCHSYLD